MSAPSETESRVGKDVRRRGTLEAIREVNSQVDGESCGARGLVPAKRLSRRSTAFT